MSAPDNSSQQGGAEDRTQSYSPPPQAQVDADDGLAPSIEGFAFLLAGPLPPFKEGGFGRVYRAHNRQRVLVAVKVVRPDLSAGPVWDLWAKECALSVALPTHEHVVRFYERETATWPDGRRADALVMEWLEGARGLIGYADALGLDKPSRIGLLLQAAEGVAWMHAHGTAHCDLKSDNLLVVERLGKSVVKVTDFGGSRAAAQAAGEAAGRAPQALDARAPTFTRSRAAPEVVSGDPAAISPRADVFSLCMECAELIGGASAVQRDRAGFSTARSMRPATGLADRALDAIIARGTQREPRHRYADAAELAHALRAYTPPALERATRAVERLLWPLGAMGGGVLRPIAAVLALVTAATLGAHLAASELAVAHVGPALALSYAAPQHMDRVLVIRERDSEGIERLAAALGIPGVSAKAPSSKRAAWGRIVEHLASLGPDAIVLDIVFARNAANPDADAAIVEPIGRAAARPARVPIVVATETFAPGTPDALEGFAIARGISEAGALWASYAVPKLEIYGESLLIPQGRSAVARAPLSVVAVAAVLGKRVGEGRPLLPHLDKDSLRLQFLGSVGGGPGVSLAAVVPAEVIRNCEGVAGIAPPDIVGLYPIGVPPDAALQEVDRDVAELANPDGSWRALDVRGRTVILAAHSADDVRKVDGRTIPGVWLHAAAIQSLLDGASVPRVAWEVLFPMGGLALAGALLGMLALVRGCSALRIPLPSLDGRWAPTDQPPAATAQRWRALALGVVAGLALGGVGALAAAQTLLAAVPYHAGMYCWGAYAGLVAGSLAVVGAAWMGCVRRAWCLDRASPRGATR